MVQRTCQCLQSAHIIIKEACKSQVFQNRAQTLKAEARELDCLRSVLAMPFTKWATLNNKLFKFWVL